MSLEDADGERRAGSAQGSVLRVAGLAVALVLAVPLYFVLVAVVPALKSVVPPRAALLLTAVGLCVVFPATVLYAHLLAGEGQEVEGREYWVGDRWERRNL